MAAKAPRALLITATPHRGSEWLFRSLMHLTDPQVFRLPTEPQNDVVLSRVRPGSVHFLRPMKEELGATPLLGGAVRVWTRALRCHLHVR